MTADLDDPVFISNGWFQKINGEWRLMGTRCRDCQKTYFPVKMVCPDCFDGELETVPLSKTGTLHTYAQSFMGPADLEKPYLMGFIDLPENIKLYSIITAGNSPEMQPRVGMRMEMFVDVVKKDVSGAEVLAYKFRPAKTEEVDHA